MKKYLLAFAMLFTFQSCNVVAWFVPPMKVWLSEIDGKAQLAEAEFSKKVAVETAKADLESAKLRGEAEIIRAKATAEANKILGDSLRNNEAYLRYLWINKIDSEKAEVYYIPTEAALPILEAGKRK